MTKEFQIVMMSPDEIIPFELNSKKHPKEQVAKIAESISRFGWDQPIVVDRNLVIIKGHGRRLAAKLLERQVPVLIRKDLTVEQANAARLADNRSAISDLDPDMLRKEMAGLEESLRGIFDDKELQFVAADLGTMNTDAFVTDMNSVLADQKSSVEGKVAAAAAGEVSLAKAFGFSKIAAAGQIAITTLMAKAEATTGKTGADALVDFVATLP